MQINADFASPAMVHTSTLEWSASPMAGVDRRMLDRIGDEVARATSIVRYAKGSAFAEHTHSGGEEFIVLEGVFQDEHGDYPAGTYVRNPVGTRHTPRSEDGCTIFVKLWQFDPADCDQFALDLTTLPLTADSRREGVREAVLAKRGYEHVALEVWDANTCIEMSDKGGFELLVLKGDMEIGGDRFGVHDWVRWPPGQKASVTAGGDGARIWIKRGHLRDIRVPGQTP